MKKIKFKDMKGTKTALPHTEKSWNNSWVSILSSTHQYWDMSMRIVNSKALSRIGLAQNILDSWKGFSPSPTWITIEKYIKLLISFSKTKSMCCSFKKPLRNSAICWKRETPAIDSLWVRKELMILESQLSSSTKNLSKKQTSGEKVILKFNKSIATIRYKEKSNKTFSCGVNQPSFQSIILFWSAPTLNSSRRQLKMT